MSDHFSGPRAIAGPAGDICDLYAFPSPETEGRLVLVMNVLPLADPAAFFSDAITCRFRLRPLSLTSERPGPLFAVGTPELLFDVTFETPAPIGDGLTATQVGQCSAPAGVSAAFRVHDESGGHSDGLQVFAGARSDPFFIDVPALQQSIATGELAFSERGDNSLDGLNVLSVVVETERDALVTAGGGPVFAVVGETIASGKLPLRLERVGRPEVKNVVLAWKEFDQLNRDIELRDLYNLEDAFHLGKDYLTAYRARLNANLAMFDRLDGKIDWPLDEQGTHPLTDLLLADHLVVDVSKPFAPDSFLEIERAALAGRKHTSCGGRAPNDDVMDGLYSLLVNAGDGHVISDGVHQATTPAPLSFPYLAPPSPMPAAPKEAHA